MFYFALFTLVPLAMLIGLGIGYLIADVLIPALLSINFEYWTTLKNTFMIGIFWGSIGFLIAMLILK